MKKSLEVFTRISCLILLFMSVEVASQNLDTTFKAVPSNDITDSSSTSFGEMIILPGGKLLVYGSFDTVNGVSVGKLVRLNDDGTIDSAFNCFVCNDIVDMTVLAQTDAKIIVAGRTAGLEGRSIKSAIFRINSDGSLDNTFANSFEETFPLASHSAKILNQQADGKIYIAYEVSQYGGTFITLYRLNIDGSIDTSFQSIQSPFASVNRSDYHITPLPSGKMYFHGTTPLGAITKLNSDGTEDSSFAKPTFSRASLFAPENVTDIVVQSDGNIVVAGRFIRVNGIERLNFTRLNSDGSLDLKFENTTDQFTPPLIEYSDGKLLINRQTASNGNYLPAKRTADGGSDTSFDFPPNLISVSYFSLDKTTNKIYIFGRFEENGIERFRYARLNADGSLDSSFNNTIGHRGVVNGLAIQGDQKIVMVGEFERVNETVKATIARVNSDGTLDETLDGGDGFVGATEDIVVASDGKFYVYGGFSSFDGNNQSKLIRLNPDGSFDSTFTPTLNDNVKTLVLQSDGKLLIGGRFTVVNGQTVKSVARLNSDGSFDSSFDPLFGGVLVINKIALQSDGKILVGGDFSGIGGFNRNNFARLNADGSYDSGFNPTVSTVFDIAQLANGQYLAMSSEIEKFNADGSIDTSFDSPRFGFTEGDIFTRRQEFTVLSDDSVVVNGTFDRVDGFEHIGFTRLSSDGTWVGSTSRGGANREVLDLEVQNDGKIVIGGGFSQVENDVRVGVARLNLPTLIQTADYDFDGDGKADIAVFRPSENKWYILRSSDFGVTQQIFAITGDSPVPGDFDGDGKTDYSIFRNSQGDWWSLASSSGNQVFAHYGQDEDIPMPTDFDGDGRTDYVVYRPTNFTWYRISSSTGVTSDLIFGAAGDKPVMGDFDGDGKSDAAIYRPSTGTWWWQSSIDNSQAATQWGASTDIPTSGDYDGDGKTDFAIYRPSTGVWWIFNSSTQNATMIQFGISEDKPVAADYDGDGKVDIAVYRPSTGVWYLLQSTDGFAAYQFGISTDIPIPNAFTQ